MKKFSNITDKEGSLDFKSDNKGILSNDVDKLDDIISDESKLTKLDGEWEIVSIIDVTKNQPEINEAIIINAELGDKTVKRGDDIWITAMIRKKDQPYHQHQMGVLKVRVVDIYNNLFILNTLKR
jgi:hypothetical protein